MAVEGRAAHTVQGGGIGDVRSATDMGAGQQDMDVTTGSATTDVPAARGGEGRDARFAMDTDTRPAPPARATET